MSNVKQLCEALDSAKTQEAKAIEQRRAIEDELIKCLDVDVDQLDGTENIDRDGVKIKLTGRVNRTIDSEALQQLAIDAGLTQHLGSLFRWRPSINMREWKAADESITAPLASAITAKAGRPSISVSFE